MGSKSLVLNNGSAPELTAHPALQAALRDLGTPQRAAKGAYLFRQGDPCRGVWLVTRGKVLLSLETPNGNLLPYRMVPRGSLIGLPACISGQPYSLTAEARDGVELVYVPRDRFMEMLSCENDLCLHTVQTLGEELLGLRLMQARVVGTPRRRRRR